MYFSALSGNLIFIRILPQTTHMKNATRLLYLLAIIRFVLPFLLVHPSYQLHRDEYLYLAEGHHLAWGFLEVPPMLSFMAYISNALGTTEFWVKFWPALFGSLILLMMGKIILRLGGRSFAILLASFPFLFTGYIRMFYFFHPNFLDVFFWTLNAYALINFIDTRKHTWLYIFGISIGLGMLSKYSVAFYTISLLVGLLFTRDRSIFLNKHLYFAGGLALLILLPNLVWQYQHGFPIFMHMDELKETQLQFIDPKDFLVDQIMMFLPCVFIWISGLLYVLFSAEGRKYQMIGWSYFAVIALLTYMNGKSYYAAGAYPILFAFGAYWLEKLTVSKLRLLRYVMVFIPVALGILIMPLLLPIYAPQKLADWYRSKNIHTTGSFKWEDLQYHPLPQDFADMIGWKELAEKTAAVYKSLPKSEQRKTMIYCRGYYTAGALNYYAKQTGLPIVYSDDASFLFWMPEQYDFKHLILVGKKMPDADDIVFQQFEKVSLRDSIDYPLFRETKTKIFLFEQGNDSLQPIIERGVAALKARFSQK